MDTRRRTWRSTRAADRADYEIEGFWPSPSYLGRSLAREMRGTSLFRLRSTELTSGGLNAKNRAGDCGHLHLPDPFVCTGREEYANVTNGRRHLLEK